MRTGIALALGLLVTAPACNTIFGVNPTQAVDAPEFDVRDSRPGNALVTWWNSVSTPFDTITFQPIVGLTVEIGGFDGVLVPAPVDGNTGAFAINQPGGQPYRIVYHVPNDPVPHEAQWDFIDNIHLTVPLFGRLSRRNLPNGSGYKIEVANAPQPYPCQPSPPAPPCLSQRTGLIAFSTGTWMTGQASYNPSTTPATITLPSTNLEGLSGAVDQLVVTDDTRDTLVLVHYNNSPTPQAQWRADAYLQVDLTAPLTTGALTDLGSELIKRTADVNTFNLLYHVRPLPPDTQIQQALGGLYFSVGATSVTEGIPGVLPNLVMPAMALPPRDGFDSTVFLALDHEISWSNNTCPGVPYPHNPMEMSPDEYRPPAIMYRQYRSRPAIPSGTLQLPSGYQIVTADSGLGACTSGGGTVPQLPINIGIAKSAMFVTPLVTDQTAITVPANTFQELTFQLDDASHTDDCVITNYRVDTTAMPESLVPVRTILVPAKTGMMHVQVPTADFQSGATHVFGIVCRNGYPKAATGDYTAFSGFPQQESQVFPATFVVTVQ
jgi:hypothetical protein